MDGLIGKQGIRKVTLSSHLKRCRLRPEKGCPPHFLPRLFTIVLKLFGWELNPVDAKHPTSQSSRMRNFPSRCTPPPNERRQHREGSISHGPIATQCCTMKILVVERTKHRRVPWPRHHAIIQFTHTRHGLERQIQKRGLRLSRS